MKRAIFILLFCVLFPACSRKPDLAALAMLQYTVGHGLEMAGIVEGYKEKTGAFPTFDKLEHCLRSHNRLYDECIVPSLPNARITRYLDGQGGWSYNEKTGQLLINRVNPVRLMSDGSIWIIPSEIVLVGNAKCEVRGTATKEDSKAIQIQLIDNQLLMKNFSRSLSCE